MRTGSDWASAIRKCTIDYHWQGWWRTQTQAKAYKMFANTTEWKNDNMTRTLQCCLVLFLRLLVALLVFHWNLSLVHFGLYQQEGRHRCGCLCGPVFFLSFFIQTYLFVWDKNRFVPLESVVVTNTWWMTGMTNTALPAGRAGFEDGKKFCTSHIRIRLESKLRKSLLFSSLCLLRLHI